MATSNKTKREFDISGENWKPSTPVENNNEDIFDVVVVGAGFAGMNAARILSDKGYSVVVVEARFINQSKIMNNNIFECIDFKIRDRVGGRSYTHKGNGYSCDRGCGYWGPTQDEVMKLAEELGVQRYKVYNQGESKKANFQAIAF